MTSSFSLIVRSSFKRNARMFIVVIATVLSSGTALSAERSVVATTDAIDLNNREQQVSAILKDGAIPNDIASRLREPPPAPPPRPPGMEPLNLQLPVNRNPKESITVTQQNNPLFAGNESVKLIIGQEADAVAYVSRVSYVLKNQIKTFSANGYSRQELWNWEVKVDGRPSYSISQQEDLSRPEALVAIAGSNAASDAPAVAVVGVYRESKAATETFGRIALLDQTRNWRFDRVFGAKDVRKSTFIDAVFLDNTNEILVLGNADDSMWLMKFDAATRLPLWNRIYDLTKFRLTPVPQGISITRTPKLEAARLARMPDGDFVIVGTSTNTPTDTDLMVVRLTPDGKIRWARACGGAGNDSGRVVYPMRDGNIIVGGSARSKGDYLGWLLKLDAEGYVVWEKKVGRESVDGIFPDGGGYLVTDFYRNLFAVRTTAENSLQEYNWNGDLAWTKQAPFARSNSRASVLEEPALTCQDSLWIPTVNDAISAMNGRSLGRPIRDRRAE